MYKTIQTNTYHNLQCICTCIANQILNNMAKKKPTTNDVILSSFWYYERIPLYSFKCEVWCISNDIHVLFSTIGTKQSNRYFSLSEHYPQNILFSYGRQITVKLIMTMILSIYLCNLGQNVSLHDIRTK